MYAIAISTVMLWLASIVASQSGQNFDLMMAYKNQAQRTQVVGLAENIQQYFNDFGTYPTSLTALSATAGFEQTRSLFDSWQGYAISPVLIDSTWQFSRAVLFSNNPVRGVTPTNYLSLNACGAGTFFVASSWCGSKSSAWYRSESRETYSNLINTQRARLNRTLQRFGDYYNANNTFPSGVLVNTTATLASLVGYSGTSLNCTGTYQWAGVPIDCTDMFDQWGNLVGFNFFSASHITLISETPLFNAAGTRMIVAADFNVM